MFRRFPSRVSAAAFRSPRAWSLLLITVVLAFPVDLFTKHWSFATVADRPVVLDRDRLLADQTLDPVPRHSSLIAIPNLLQYRLVVNRGAVFGFGANRRAFFIIFTFIALGGAIYLFARMTGPRAHLAHIAAGLVLAGGLGNLYDRVSFGVVRDFLHMLPGHRLPFGWTWPGGSPELFPWVFNLADVMLLVGMVLLMLSINRPPDRAPQEPEAAAVELGMGSGD